jgi:penicillin-binding protein 2
MSTAWFSWQVSRRAAAAQAVLALAFLVLGAAFFKAQVVDHQRFATESASNRLRAIPLPAPRGEILDRNGLLIAENVPGFTIRLLASREDSLRAVLARLDALIPWDTVDVEDIIARWEGAQYQPVLVYGSGDPAVVATLEEHRAALPGLVIQAEPRRRYPAGPGVAHLTGYVGEVNQADLDKQRFPGARAGELVGKIGLEHRYDSLLRGRTGIRYVEVTARGHTVRDQVSTMLRPVAGTTIRTTIDLPLQQFIDSMWRADLPDKRGAMLAMTPDGQILAYYAWPAFDPNDFIGGITAANYRALTSDPARPLYDRVVRGKYPPASPFKLAIAAMGLKRGLVTMGTRMPVPCTGGYQFGSRRFKCWKRDGGHGSLDLTGAIATSCDVYFYQLGLKLGREAIFEDGRAYGIDVPTGIDVDNEGDPTFPVQVKDYINSKGVSFWSGGEVLNLSIGQGMNAQTLVSMTALYAAMAGDGIRRAPYIVRRPLGTPQFNLGLTPEQLQGLRQAMSDVVVRGTAAASGGSELEVAGKTGTGQVTGQKDIGWFIAFAPLSVPKIVVAIAVEEGEHGSTVAPYVVKAIRRYLVGPDTTAVQRPVQINITEDLTADSTTAAATDSTGGIR